MKAKNPPNLNKVYSILLARYGHRNWWPGETPDEIIIGAILTQNVAWSNVETALRGMRESGISTLQDVLASPDEELATLIRSTRYYNQKTAKLKAFARFFQQGYGSDFGNMFAEELPSLRGKMLAIKGLGPETVDSILLYAGNLPVFVIDSYTERLLARLGFQPEKRGYQAWQDLVVARIPISLYNDLHAQIVCHCKTLCRPNPLCGDCPLAKLCAFSRAAIKA